MLFNGVIKEMATGLLVDIAVGTAASVYSCIITYCLAAVVAEKNRNRT